MSFMSFLAGPSLAEMAIRSILDMYNSDSKDANASPQEKAETVETAGSILDIQAKAQQELSIAKRIMIAETVEITEEYEASGAGGLGFKNDPSVFQAGAHGEGRKMTKRTIKFAGFNQKIEEVISHLEETYKATHMSENPSPTEALQPEARTSS
ncbi:MAG: hypothetical protein E6559_17350 [Pantoea sp.]|uniref:hypothetical protein n=2 Tax=Pantoea piersonii TaxID=2364647 RepID=UPI0028B09E03|nr:hypothetical protein [Pantoea piersonii]MDU6441634.1 hypothetical protein [Pantoea sp.]